MDKNKYTISTCIASPPDREKVVYEIVINNEQFAEVNQETEKRSVEIYPKKDGAPWILELEELIDLLQKAKKNLK